MSEVSFVGRKMKLDKAEDGMYLFAAFFVFHECFAIIFFLIVKLILIVI